MATAVDSNALRIVPLTKAHAEDIVTWRYECPYDVYDLTGADPEELLDPTAGFHAVLADGRLAGFRSFGPDGQVPGWIYDDAALDTGGGLRPELTGQGLGRAVIEAGLANGIVRSARNLCTQVPGRPDSCGRYCPVGGASVHTRARSAWVA